jgi:hypothetical protein
MHYWWLWLGSTASFPSLEVGGKSTSLTSSADPVMDGRGWRYNWRGCKWLTVPQRPIARGATTCSCRRGDLISAVVYGWFQHFMLTATEHKNYAGDIGLIQALRCAGCRHRTSSYEY